MTNESSPSLADVRAFLEEYFGDQELTDLCADHFPRVYREFTTGMLLGHKIQQLLDYCQRQELLPELYAQLRRKRPAQWTRLIDEGKDRKKDDHLPAASDQHRRPFKNGLNPFEVEDADIFLGRPQASERLFERICADRLVVVMGWSGSGKSSLVKAGVIPRLQADHYPTVYAQVRELITQDVMRAINDELAFNGVAKIETLDQLPAVVLALQSDDSPALRPLVLIIDQFDQALSPAHSADDRSWFLKSLVFLLKAARQLVKVVIVTRADWQFLLEQAIREFDLNLSSLIFPVDYLTREEAYRALTGPLEKDGLSYDAVVVNDILDRLLEHDTESASTDKRIQPVHLQLVADSLTSLAEQRGNPNQALTAEIYQSSGGVESILRNYLARLVRDREAVWHLLARFLTVDGQSRSLHLSQLVAISSIQVDGEVQELVRDGLLQAYQVPDQETYYRLSHDYLVSAIAAHLAANLDQHGWKLAEDWLAEAVTEEQAARAWQTSKSQSQQLDDQQPDSVQVSQSGGDETATPNELLLERSRYFHVYQYRAYLDLREEAARSILVRSALQYGHEGLGGWLASDPRGRQQELQAAVDRLLSKKPEIQANARLSVVRSAKVPAEIVQPLTDRDVVTLSNLLRPQLHLAEKRLASAQALWRLKSFSSLAERMQIGQIVFGAWLKKHARIIAFYTFSLLAVALVIFGLLFVRDRLRGSWEMIDSFKASPVLGMWTDPSQPGTTFALVFGDPGTHAGASILALRDGKWEMRVRDFSKSYPNAFTVTPHGLFFGFYGEGLRRSLDGGQTWQLVNRGLPTRAFSGLVADPYDTQVLYLGTSDYWGVLRSTDNGDSWQAYDYAGEIYGAQVTAIAYTQANGGQLLAGTGDGRIIGHPRSADQWTLRSNRARGGITSLAVAPSDNTILYATTSRALILRSQDGGETWQLLGQVANQFRLSSIQVDPLDPNRLLAVAYGQGGNTVWKSEDGGDHWSSTASIGLPRSTIFFVSADPNNPQRLFGFAADGLFASDDGASTWQNVPLETSLATVKGLAIGSDVTAPIYAFRNGSIYTNLSGDLRTWTYGKGVEAEIVRTVAVDPQDPYSAYAGVLLIERWAVYKTTDGGQTWVTTTVPSIGPVVPNDVTALAIASDRASKRTVVYAGTLGCGLFRSENGGVSWDTYGRTRCDQSSAGNMPSDVFFLAVAPTQIDTIYAGAGQKLYCSADGGTRWRDCSPGMDSPINSLVADPVEPNTVYLIAGTGGFWRSRDRGVTWVKLGEFANTDLTALNARPGGAGQLVVGASNGEVWATNDSGESWVSQRENLAVSTVTGIVTSRGLADKILIGTQGEGLALFTPGQVFGSRP